MRIPCGGSSLCYDFHAIDSFLNSKEVQAELGVDKYWLKCNYDVHDLFNYDWMKNYDTKIPDVLAAGIRVLVYAGDTDYICNWLGNKKWALAMDWPHQSEFNASEDLPYNVSGAVAGRLRSFQNFHFMQVFQAGHMMPTDQPKASLQMLEDFITGKFDPAPSTESRSNSEAQVADKDGLNNNVLLILAATSGVLVCIVLIGRTMTLFGRQHDISSYKVLLG
mmetsp:Transcript_154414/g.273889  ORF Transcript_154414/g.273889 Transcript_154414/m.273889 type:complete len:221 (+) Transcript_154414:2-664(+)